MDKWRCIIVKCIYCVFFLPIFSPRHNLSLIIFPPSHQEIMQKQLFFYYRTSDLFLYLQSLCYFFYSFLHTTVCIHIITITSKKAFFLFFFPLLNHLTPFVEQLQADHKSCVLGLEWYLSLACKFFMNARKKMSFFFFLAWKGTVIHPVQEFIKRGKNGKKKEK